MLPLSLVSTWIVSVQPGTAGVAVWVAENVTCPAEGETNQWRWNATVPGSAACRDSPVGVGIGTSPKSTPVCAVAPAKVHATVFVPRV